MSTTRSVNGDSQAFFVGTLLFGALLLAVGTATSLFSVTKPYFSTTADRWLAIAVSLVILGTGVATILYTLK